MPRKRVQVLAALLASALFVSLVIIAALVYQRVKVAWGPEYETYGNLKETDFSREGGHLIPDMDVLASGEYLDRPVRWVTNSKGFRNTSEFTYEVPEDTFRILFMGDSYVDGYRTDQEQTIGAGLERELSAAACRQGLGNLEVMLSGHNNPAAVAHSYQEHGRKYEPHLVILGITVGNDITPRDYKKTIWPERRESDGEVSKLVLSDRPSEQNNWQDIYLPDDAYVPRDRFGQFFLEMEKDTRKNLGRNVPGMGQLVPPVFGQPKPNKRFRVHAGANLTSMGLFYDPVMPDVEEWFRDLDEIILAMNDQVVSNGGRLLVVIFPTRIQVDARDWRMLEKFFSFDVTKFRLDYPSTRIQQFCGTHEIDCLDLLPGFRDTIEKNGSHLFMGRGDMHYNADGQALASEIMAAHICGRQAG